MFRNHVADVLSSELQLGTEALVDLLNAESKAAYVPQVAELAIWMANSAFVLKSTTQSI